MRFLILAILFAGVSAAWAEDNFGASDYDREPAAVTPLSKRAYPGGADEEDLKVLATVPDATQKTDSRSVQREVYKTLYNQDLKEDRGNEQLEE